MKTKEVFYKPIDLIKDFAEKNLKDSASVELALKKLIGSNKKV